MVVEFIVLDSSSAVRRLIICQKYCFFYIPKDKPKQKKISTSHQFTQIRITITHEVQ